ncbi:hypothetical protein DCG74_38090 [Bradyrhizobium sp. WBAH42]|nr:hypothetical protein DCG74_38090 [Bradyrhizobium sp. WBAH42]
MCSRHVINSRNILPARLRRSGSGGACAQTFRSKGTDWSHPTRVLPASGYVLDVDGQFKTEYASKDGAWSGAVELKRGRPMLQIRI